MGCVLMLQDGVWRILGRSCILGRRVGQVFPTFIKAMKQWQVTRAKGRMSKKSRWWVQRVLWGRKSAVVLKRSGWKQQLVRKESGHFLLLWIDWCGGRQLMAVIGGAQEGEVRCGCSQSVVMLQMTIRLACAVLECVGEFNLMTSNNQLSKTPPT